MTHAWLFTGPPGSGRSVAARAFAAALLCPDGGCGHCAACHQVLTAHTPTSRSVRPDGLSYSVKQTARSRPAGRRARPRGGRWRVVLFEDADRLHRAAANALLKAIEEPPPGRCGCCARPSAEDLMTTIRSRCRVVTLRTPPADAVADVLASRDRVTRRPAAGRRPRRSGAHRPGAAARHWTTTAAAGAGGQVLADPAPLSTGSARRCPRPRRLVRTAEEEAKAVTERARRARDRRAAPGVRRGVDGQGRRPRRCAARAGALKDLEDRQKSRATRIKRDSLDRALLDLAGFYRDVLMMQVGAGVELANADHRGRAAASWRTASSAGGDAAPDRGDHALPRTPRRQRRPAAGRRGDDDLPHGG